MKKAKGDNNGDEEFQEEWREEKGEEKNGTNKGNKNGMYSSGTWLSSNSTNFQVVIV